MPAVTSNTQIAQLALDLLGDSKRIASLDEDSATARICSRWYTPTLHGLLERAPWTFARTEKTLSAVSDVTSVRYPYLYTWPSDCVTPLWIWTGLRDGLSKNLVIPFGPVANPTGAKPYIGTEISPAVLIYTYLNLTTPQYPGAFVMAFANLLAARLTGPLTAQPTRMAFFEQEAERYLQEALAVNGESFDDFQQQDGFTASRWGPRSWPDFFRGW